MAIPAVLVGILKALSPFVIAAGQKVAPEVENKIKEILREAETKVAELRGTHSVQSIKAAAVADIAAIRAAAEHHVQLIEAQLVADLERAKAKLPSFNFGPAPVPPMTTGPSGATGA